jgi:hypothetical protein
MAAFNLNATVTGLATFSVVVPNAGVYPVSGKIELPTIDQGASANSAVVMTVVLNPSGANTTIYTGGAGARGFQFITGALSAGDTLAFTTSSAAAVDQPINAVKSTISVG